MSVFVDGSSTNTRNSTRAGTKKRIWPRRVMASATKFQIPSSKFQRNPKLQAPIDGHAQGFGAWILNLLYQYLRESLQSATIFGPRLCAEHQPQHLRTFGALWRWSKAWCRPQPLRLVLRTQPRSFGCDP